MRPAEQFVREAMARQVATARRVTPDQAQWAVPPVEQCQVLLPELQVLPGQAQ